MPLAQPRVAQNRQVTPVGNGFHWVLRQPPGSYTLQIGSVTDERKVIKFIQSNGIESNSAYIKVVIDGVTRYNALFGTYPSYSEATQAIEELPEPIKRAKPWVRNFGILHKLIQKDG